MGTTDEPQAGRRERDRRAGERRAGERRAGGGRRAEDRARERRMTMQAAAWALCGALVVLYLFFVAIGGIQPDDAPAATIVALGLAVLWLAHSWRRLWGGGYSSRPDRERRGF